MRYTFDSVLTDLTAYLHTLGAPDVSAEANLTRDLSIDSLQVFQVIERLEETYKIVIPLELLYKQRVETVGELVNEVLRLTEKS